LHHLFHGHYLEAALDIQPELLADLMIEQEWIEEPRRLGEIIAAINGLVDKETFPVHDHRSRPIQCDIWEGALKAAAKVEMEYGVENFGPWDDFEWGMINGKLFALRWVLGDEWDMLDT
jgi:hypothetical protein